MKTQFFGKLAFFLVLAIGVVPAAAGAYSLNSVLPNWGNLESARVVNNGRADTAYALDITVSVIDENDAILLDENGQKDWFTAFCIEPDQRAKTGRNANYDVELVAPSMVQGGLESAWLMENMDRYTPDEYASHSMAALQFAIWKVVKDYNTDYSFDLSGGNFYWTNIRKKTGELASMYLDNLRNYFDPTGLDGMYAASLHGDHQDFMIAAPGIGAAPVPEPASMVLLAFGLIGVAGMGRKFNRKK
jgi:hypothetical protein